MMKITQMFRYRRGANTPGRGSRLASLSALATLLQVISLFVSADVFAQVCTTQTFGNRDFRGISPDSFDGRGNLALGLKEQIVFPEINYDQVGEIRGLNVVICTTAKNDDEARALLKGFDVPFTGWAVKKELDGHG